MAAGDSLGTCLCWALEEVGPTYNVRLLSFDAMKEPAHRKLQPFGQIPTYEEGKLALFESGAIVFHIAERGAGLLPEDPDARARAIAWMFAALNTLEPPIFDRDLARVLERNEPWYEQRLHVLEDRIRSRVSDLSARRPRDIPGGHPRAKPVQTEPV
jgi:glutathione S-transferase